MKFPSKKRIALFVVIVGVMYWYLFNRTPHGKDCISSTSTNGIYIAELCMLRWSSRDDPEYAGRIYDAKSGKLLLQRTFPTSVPAIMWLDKRGILFSVGGDEAVLIYFPPSTWDKLLAARPRTHNWSIFDLTASKHVTGDWSPRPQRSEPFNVHHNMRCFDSRTGKEASCTSPELPPEPKQ
jgi:hypothetical protein